MTADSIDGAGTFNVRPKALTVGLDDSTMAVSGVIEGIGGSLTKAGAGTLTLSGANTYTGGTTVSAGTLLLSGSGTLGSILATAA
jgi:fibronectin-binding autotransporter adhesin